jgi:branched-chain amino acid transport system ATP-binding protein
MLRDLRDRERLSIVMVERNARRGLAAADIGCVIIGGEIVQVGTGVGLLNDPTVNRLFPDTEARFSARRG